MIRSNIYFSASVADIFKLKNEKLKLIVLFNVAALLLLSAASLKAAESSVQSQWGHYVKTGIGAGVGGIGALMQVKISGNNAFWQGTFVVHGMMNSQTGGTNTWSTVSLLDWAGYNTGQGTVKLQLMSNDNGGGYQHIEAVILSDAIEPGVQTVVSVITSGFGAQALSLASQSSAPYSNILANSAESIILSTKNFNLANYPSNVGIGTAATDSRLSVSKDFSGIGGSVGKYRMTDWGINNNVNILKKNAGGQSSIDLISGTANDAMIFKVRGDGKSFFMGDMAIGCDDAKEYKLAVAGPMIAESVKVKLQSAWPDYVFTKAHQLPSLSEVEKFIRTNNHLPEIPSAKEVEAEGISLGEMNAKLLKKIEELTLYMIEIKKEIVELREQKKDK